MERKGKKPKRKTAFVPSVVFTTAIAGVVPACVIGCGNGGSGGTLPSVAGCGYGTPAGNCPTVAAVGYCAYCDGGDADAPSEAQPDGTPDATEAGGDAAGDSPGDAPPDAPFSVADAGFGGG
jgi:hypothetical protein